MTEDTQTTDTETVVTEPTLDDVIAEYKPQPVQAAPAQPAAQPAQPQVATSAPIDPLDTEQFNAHVNQVNTGQSVLSNQLQDVQAKLTQMEERSERLQIETDISDAVTRLNDGLNLDPDLVRIHLEHTAQKKPGFKALWDNRKQDPASFDKALKALSREIGTKHNTTTDPELVANQVAIKQSQQSRSTTTANDTSGNKMEDALAEAKTPGDFNNEWQRLTGG